MFAVDIELIDRAGEVLSVHPYVYWILGGAGSGKSTICAELSRACTIPVYDMDEHIYGASFSRYRPERHPANTAWAAAEDGMQWLLAGGVYHPELLSRVIPRERIVSLAASHLDSTAVWTGTDERLAMKEMIGPPEWSRARVADVPGVRRQHDRNHLESGSRAWVPGGFPIAE